MKHTIRVKTFDGKWTMIASIGRQSLLRHLDAGTFYLDTNPTDSKRKVFKVFQDMVLSAEGLKIYLWTDQTYIEADWR